MTRREFLQSGGMVCAGMTMSARRTGAQPLPSDWRSFELTTRVEVLKPSGVTRIWLPAPLVSATPYQRRIDQKAEAPGGEVQNVTIDADALDIVCATFPAGVTPVLSLTSRVATRDHAIDLATPRAIRGERDTVKHFLRPTKLLPTDGIVRDTAMTITRGLRTDLDKARAIYTWVVDNTFREAETQGCGLGDIRFMLETKDLGGKCADLNALFVGLARAAGLPARDVYGIRAAKSARGYTSLGTSSPTITRAQHCRAEVFIDQFGWIPVDPADVRKVVLEEPPGKRPLDDPLVITARERLFGSWEMNWIAFNFAHDVVLPGSKGPALPFLMYPQAETSAGRIDPLDPDAFKYDIRVR